MRAAQFMRTGYGKTDREAYDYAYEEAQDEKGHRDGYSGDLNSKDGYRLEEPPVGVDVQVWINAILRGELSANLERHRELFDEHVAIYEDKHASALCFRTSDGEYEFMGYAPE